jgi:hypothetical protein
VITPSDAVKFRLLVKGNVDAPRLLWPTKADVWYVKLFLDETAELINEQVAIRMGQLLTIIHGSHPVLFAPDVKAQELADLFQTAMTIAAHTQNPT